jgi:hypothetical protein
MENMDNIIPDDIDEESLDIAPDEEDLYEEDDALLYEGVDDSFKTQDMKVEEEQDNEREKDEIDSEEDEENQREINVSQKNTKKRRKYKVFPLLYKEEYSNLLGDIAYEISNSLLNVPEECETLFNVESGNSIEIATNWMLYYKKFPIPGKYIIRNVNGHIQKIKPESLIFDYELNNNQETSVDNNIFFSNFH